MHEDLPRRPSGEEPHPIEYPDLFAASYIVAGQWDLTKVEPLADDKLRIVVAQGDDNACPGENKITSALEKEGAEVSRAVWDGGATAAQFATDVAAMAAKGTSINDAPLKKGTVVPAGETDNSISNHLSTWTIAYNIEGIREWIFQQHR
ncbi:hypothetical protein [Streptomyces sp. NBC_01373]|uniref:hypothetical protein n=1 Tax=Streptomyces sp. NBC_01373 TaxID=2903843 RepID=UPI00225B362D|nr:hypothetical protein [Streptomyces sp. NBC_01373]MCX4705897.1 hypothetical protein [Streptomyces sp. NBC_01373]